MLCDKMALTCMQLLHLLLLSMAAYAIPRTC